MSRKPPVLHGSSGDRELTDRLLAPLGRTSRTWWILLAVSGAGTAAFVVAIVWSVTRGVGAWGNNIPVGWGIPIVTFVWWIGIGHAGTFLSAFLFLMGQRWRASIGRIAETMTLIALINAGIFPLLHMGRLWFAYWLFPYPSTLEVWPQFKSSLPWDLAAIGTYLMVSFLFWYLGLLPDLASLRDRAGGRLRRLGYGLLALGWRGSGRQWRVHGVAYVLLAALATPLIITVSTDFSVAILPGWHSTLFPPYFVAGSLYTGLAMVVILVVVVRRAFELEDLITLRHLDHLAKLILVMGSWLIYSYVVETFAAWYGTDEYTRYTYLVDRTTGPYAWMHWGMLAVNLVVPQLFWLRRLRRSVPVLLGGSVLVLVAMLAERFLVVVGSQSRDFLPSAWRIFTPTLTDWGMLVGSLALFAFLFLLFVRFLPVVSIHEMRELRSELQGET